MWRIGGTIIPSREGGETSLAGASSTSPDATRGRPQIQSYGTMTPPPPGDQGYDTNSSRAPSGQQGKAAGTGTDDEGGSSAQPVQTLAFDPANRTIRFPDETHDSTQGGGGGGGGLRGRTVVATTPGDEE